MNINRYLIVLLGRYAFALSKVWVKTTFTIISKSIEFSKLKIELAKTTDVIGLDKKQINGPILYKMQEIYYFNLFNGAMFGRTNRPGNNAAYLKLIAKKAEFLTQY